MNTGAMKNIVILKDLPSNLVEEAIIFLKENQKLKSPELIDRESKQKKGTKDKDEKGKNEKSYIINEAQMLIADYISKVENKNQKENVSYKQLKKKYQNLKKITIILAVGLAISIFSVFVL